jgi:hypothetical protein
MVIAASTSATVPIAVVEAAHAFEAAPSPTQPPPRKTHHGAWNLIGDGVGGDQTITSRSSSEPNSTVPVRSAGVV